MPLAHCNAVMARTLVWKGTNAPANLHRVFRTCLRIQEWRAINICQSRAPWGAMRPTHFGRRVGGTDNCKRTDAFRALAQGLPVVIIGMRRHFARAVFLRAKHQYPDRVEAHSLRARCKLFPNNRTPRAKWRIPRAPRELTP